MKAIWNWSKSEELLWLTEPWNGGVLTNERCSLRRINPYSKDELRSDVVVVVLSTPSTSSSSLHLRQFYDKLKKINQNTNHGFCYRNNFLTKTK